MTRGESARGTRHAADHDLALRLHAAAIHLLRRVRLVDPGAGIGPARLSALSVLVFAGARTLGELAAAEQVTPATMSRVVSGLESEGLAERRPHGEDRRAILVRATSRGRRLMARARERRIGALMELLGPLDAEEARTLEGALTLLERRLTSLASTSSVPARPPDPGSGR